MRRRSLAEWERDRPPALQTNASRLAHRGAIEAQIYTGGYVYVCPRCGWRAPRPKRHQVGAEYDGMRHQPRCPALGGSGKTAPDAL